MSDRDAFALYKDVRDVPLWRFWLSPREKREARELFARLRGLLMIESAISGVRPIMPPNRDL